MNAALELSAAALRNGQATMRFDLRVEAGEWLAVIGPSGAGKSTLLDLAAGFLVPEGGSIRVAGRDMAGVGPAERPLTVMFQDNNLFPHLSALRNVALGLSPRLRLRADEADRARRALVRVGLGGLEERRPAELSGGERQRVALARAFLRQRPLLLLDEPFAALGPALRRDMLDLLATLRRASATPMAVVMVTHHPEDARGFADRVAFVENGRVAAVGATSEVLSGAHHPGIAAYLGHGAAVGTQSVSRTAFPSQSPGTGSDD